MGQYRPAVVKPWEASRSRGGSEGVYGDTRGVRRVRVLRLGVLRLRVRLPGGSSGITQGEERRRGKRKENESRGKKKNKAGGRKKKAGEGKKKNKAGRRKKKAGERKKKKKKKKKKKREKKKKKKKKKS